MVSPSATQPGRSGDHARTASCACSTTPRSRHMPHLNPACFRMLRSVPSGKSLPSCQVEDDARLSGGRRPVATRVRATATHRLKDSDHVTDLGCIGPSALKSCGGSALVGSLACQPGSTAPLMAALPHCPFVEAATRTS